jgi:hypothetical protein
MLDAAFEAAVAKFLILAEAGWVPDWIMRRGIRYLLCQRRRAVRVCSGVVVAK